MPDEDKEKFMGEERNPGTARWAPAALQNPSTARWAPKAALQNPGTARWAPKAALLFIQILVCSQVGGTVVPSDSSPNMQAALDSMMQRVMASTESQVTKSRKVNSGAKAAPPAAGAASSTSVPAAPSLSSGSLGEPETTWVAKLVGVALRDAVTGMGSVLETRFVGIETEIVRQNAFATATLNNTLATQNEVVELNRKLGELTAKLEEVQLQAVNAEAVFTGRLSQVEEVASQSRSHGLPPGLPSAPAPAFQELPYESRTTAILGGLGWDNKGSELLAEANRILLLAGVEASTYEGLSAMANRADEGSAAALIFRSPAELQKAKLLVRAANATGLQGKLVWLDARKTRLEMKPARVIHRAAQMLSDFESNRTQGEELLVNKNMAAKFLFNSRGRILYTLRGKVLWAPEGMARYDADQRNIVEGFAEE